MGIVLVIILIAIFIFVLEWSRMRKYKLKKEFVVFSLLLLFGVYYNISFFLTGHAPNPLNWIEFVIEPLNEQIGQLFS